MINIKLTLKADFIMKVMTNGMIRISYLECHDNIADEIVTFFGENNIKAYLTDDLVIIADCEHFDQNEITTLLGKELEDRGFKVSIQAIGTICD